MSEESTNAADVRVGEPVVRIEGLRKSFGDNVVLRGIDLEVQRGEVVVILGPSGSGKSTLLRCVNLLETPTDGRIFFEDTEITAKKTDINKVRAKVGMVFQNFNLFPHLTAKKNVMLAQQKVLHRGKEEAEKIAVEQQDGRVVRQRLGYLDALLHAAGEVARRLDLARQRDVHAREQLLPASAHGAHVAVAGGDVYKRQFHAFTQSCMPSQVDNCSAGDVLTTSYVLSEAGMSSVCPSAVV